MKKISTWHIHIQGQVQGVGFRPFVYSLAQKYQLKGCVNNSNDGVHIDFNAVEDVTKNFYDEVISNAPQLSHITSHCIKEKDFIEYKYFKIISSGSKEKPLLLISPDFAMCINCRKEISDKKNRRYGYAFTTCTQCGPRYSIIKKIPYDRENTAMEKFKMCSNCNEEYNDPTNRRHFSQTNSCPDCAVEMELFKSEGEVVNKKNDNFIKQSIKDELQNIISGKEQSGKGENIQTTAGFLRRSKDASGMAEEKKFSKEEEAAILKKYISENNLWVTPYTENFIAEGAEQKVYLNPDGKSVTKITDAVFYISWGDFLNSLLLHNYFFPDTAYTLSGFTEKGNILFAVLNQAFVKATEYTNLQQIENFMLSNGFAKNSPLKNDYYHPSLGIILEDLHDENVLTSNGLITFIDTVFYLTPQFYKTDVIPPNRITNKLTEQSEFDSKKIIIKICELWNDGKIVAIKGIGGYLLTCDASNVNAIKELRKRKHRPVKPFALMFPDLNFLQNEVDINEKEKIELESNAASIVLLQLKEKTKTKLAVHEIAPKLSKIGVMLPYAPLYELLLQPFKKPIIATSGNMSNAPIVYEDDVVINELSTVADYILVHDREIISPQDDSVVQYSRYFKKRIVLRRARGFAPFYLNKKLSLTDKTILATGAMMKSSFTLVDKQNIHVSQYLGDTSNYDAQKNFENNLDHFLKLFKTQPEIILTDKHPGYFSQQLAERLSHKWNISLIKIQHHEAHFASVLGEYNLIEEEEPILGVIWDGTGLGNDGQIWGGEFFTYHQHTFLRTDHFAYFNHILGDKMAKEPRLSAFSLCNEIEAAASILQPKFSAEEWNNYNQLIKKNELKTSSTGRIFDAVASLLGLIDKASFEGEAAMLLEEEAFQFFRDGLNIPDEWLQNDTLENILSPQHLIKKILNKIEEGKARSEIAAWFHIQLVLAIQKTAIQNNYRKICFSGGVFQNALLVDLILKILGDEYELYFNKDLSPNDENISFGQLIWFAISEKAAL